MARIEDFSLERGSKVDSSPARDSQVQQGIKIPKFNLRFHTKSGKILHSIALCH